MKDKGAELTPAEWSLMEFLWENQPCTGRQATEYFRQHIGWSRSTTLTLLRRAEAKGAIVCDESNGVHTYTPLLQREEAARREARDLLDRVYQGSLSLMVNSVTHKQKLSREEIDRLYAILQRAEQEAADNA